MKGKTYTKEDATAAIAKLNTVEGFRPEPLAVDFQDASTGETRKRLPVMAQMAWFRMKYPEGKIATSVTAYNDCFVATARIYPDCRAPQGCYLSEATASRSYLPEKPSISPREWAQTAAIGIALRNAGFGLQFSMAGDAFPEQAAHEPPQGQQQAWEPIPAGTWQDMQAGQPQALQESQWQAGQESTWQAPQESAWQAPQQNTGTGQPQNAEWEPAPENTPFLQETENPANITDFPQNSQGAPTADRQATQGAGRQSTAAQTPQGAGRQSTAAQTPQNAGRQASAAQAPQGQQQQAGGAIRQMPQAAPKDQLQEAMAMPCPITKYAGRTLGDLISIDPRALSWLANKFHDDKGTGEAARLICEHALTRCKRLIRNPEERTGNGKAPHQGCCIRTRPPRRAGRQGGLLCPLPLLRQGEAPGPPEHQP